MAERKVKDMDLINQFIENYKKKFNYYETAGRLAAQQLEASLQSSGIRAIVTFRAKHPSRLKAKVIRRNEFREIPYRNMHEIYADIADLSGVRVSLYFPGDRDKVDTLINSLFNIAVTKRFPGQSRQPSYNKRFSGYWANHYRANLKEERLNSQQKKYAAARIEIQVASVLMHAWSEVEHDLIYKPLQGTLSEEELAILDELNGLVLTGEIALERLQSAGNERIKNKNTTFISQYDLASYLYNYLSSKYKQDDIEFRMGNVELLFRLICRLKIESVKEVEPVVKSLKLVNDKRSISQQLIDQIISGSEKRYNIYLDFLSPAWRQDTKLAPSVEFFITQWIQLENLLNKATRKLNPKSRGPFNLNTLKRSKTLDNETVNKIMALRKVRNLVVHGIEPPDSAAISRHGNEAQKLLGEVTAKLAAVPAKAEPQIPG